MNLNPLSLFSKRGRGSTTARDVEPVIGEISAPSAEERAADDLTAGTSTPGGWVVKYTDTDGGGQKATVISFDGSKKNISRDKALTLSVVYACIDRISSAIAAMPIKVIKTVDGEEIEVDSHPAKFLLEKQPNDWQTPFTLNRQFMVDALNGNGYIWIRRNINNGKFFSLQYCDANATSLDNIGNGRYVYTHTDENGAYHVIQPYDMIHLRALGNRSRKGLSPIQLHAGSIRLGMDMQEYGENFFSSGGKPSGIVGVKNQLDPKAWDKLIDNWNKGAEQARDSKNKVIFQPADVTYTAISLSPIDANLVLSMNMTRDEICGIFNVPAYMVGNLSNTTYSNISAMSTAFVKNTLMPWIVNIEQEIQKKVFYEDEIIAGYGVKFDLKAALKGTPAEMLAFFASASNAGFITRNEGRSGLGYRRDTTDETMNKFTVNVSQSKLTNEGKTDENGKSKETSAD